MDNSEIKDTMHKLSDKAHELRAYAVAYNYVLNSCKSILEGYFKEFETVSQKSEGDISDQELMRLRELNIKTKVMRDVICFMETTLESAKKGEIK